MLLMFLHASRGEAEIGENLRLVGSFGGVVTRLAVQGNTAYVSEGIHLTILDVTDPSKPRNVGMVDFPEPPGAFTVAGSLVFVCDGFSGIQIVDVSDPNHAFIRSSYFGYVAYEIVVRGNYAYVAYGIGRLQVLDISNIDAVVMRGELVNTNNDFAQGVAVSGSYAYVSANNALEIVDISNPAHPIQRGKFVTQSNLSTVAVEGSLAYLTDRSGLMIVGVSDPDAPVLEGAYSINGAGAPVVSNGVAFIPSSDRGVQAIDVSTPNRPKFLSSISKAAPTVTLQGLRAYVGGTSNGLEIYDISTIENPIFDGSYLRMNEALGVAVSGTRACIADQDRLVVAEISNPSMPRYVGSYNDGIPIESVAFQGNYAYLTGYVSGLRIVDVGDPSGPRKIGELRTPRSGRTQLDVVGTRLYFTSLLDFPTGFVTLDVADPSRPAVLGVYANYPDQFEVRGSLAYLLESDGSVQIVDVADPASPTLRGSYASAKHLSSMGLDGSHLYASTATGFDIVNISDPAHPYLQGAYLDPDIKSEGILFAHQSLVYLVNSNLSLRVVDASNPLSPVRRASLSIFYFRDMALVGEYAYVGNSFEGLEILQYTGPPPAVPTPTPAVLGVKRWTSFK